MYNNLQYKLLSQLCAQSHGRGGGGGKPQPERCRKDGRGDGKQYCRRFILAWCTSFSTIHPYPRAPGQYGGRAQLYGRTKPKKKSFGFRCGGVRPIPLNRLLSSLNLLRQTQTLYTHAHTPKEPVRLYIYTAVSSLALQPLRRRVPRTLRRGGKKGVIPFIRIHKYIHIYTWCGLYNS